MSGDALAAARRRPAADEYDTFYAGYLARVDDAPILERLEDQASRLAGLIETLRADGAAWRYAEGKWTVAEVLGHLADSERIFGMRATCIARGESADLPGFEQDDYVGQGDFEARSAASLVREIVHLRAANVEMLGALPPRRWDRRGTANGAPVTVRAVAWILAGHFEHHLRVLEERYAPAFRD